MKTVLTVLLTCGMLFSTHSIWPQCQPLQTGDETMPFEEAKLGRQGRKFIIGIEVRTSNQPNEAEKEIPQLWERFDQNGGTEQVPNKINGDSVALYTEYEGDYTEPYTLVIGSEVSSCDEIPDGFVCKEVPAATYAVFKVQGNFPESVGSTWAQIWQTPLNRTYTGDMEVYPYDFDPVTNSDAKIYIAITQ